jgi:hypothetical protein
VVNYFEWLGEITSVEFPEPHYRERWWMVEGRPVEGWDGKLVGTYNPARAGLKSPTPQFHYGMALNSWPIFSPMFREFLEQTTPGLIQFLPFQLQASKKARGPQISYFVGQFLRLIDCLDRERTPVANNWEPINEYGDFDTRWPLVLSRKLIVDERLFRIRGDCGHIIIREDLKRAIENNGFTNQRFDSIEVA